MICSGVCLVRFMVKSPAPSGRMRTLIHPGPISGDRVTVPTLSCLARFPISVFQSTWASRSDVNAPYSSLLLILWNDFH